jgi:hypothetical protein
MGTAHGAEELRLCSHGLACHFGAWGRYIGFWLGYGHTRGKYKEMDLEKCSSRPITLARDFDNPIMQVKRGTLQMWIAVSRE